MPWKPISLIQARRRFVKVVLENQKSLAQACRIFHISRKTGYKWMWRFRAQGGPGLQDRTRQPRRSPRRTPAHWLRRIRRVRRRHRRWGARKIREVLRRDFPRQKIPAARTITRWLQRWKLTRRRLPRRSPGGPRRYRGKLTEARCSNQVWTVDFKGWFRTADGRRIEPLTVRDLFSRYILAIRLLPDQQWWRVRAVFLGLWRRYGIPRIIRADNGFGSKGPAGLSRLSAWWTALAITVEFMAPGHPEQNGGHEQMHREFKADLTKPASSHPAAQRRRTLRWVQTYNYKRPHQALGQKTPAQCYRPGRATEGRLWPRTLYPHKWAVRCVRSNGQIRWEGRLRFIGEAFVGMKVGLQSPGKARQKIYLAKILLGELRAADIGGLRPAIYLHNRWSKKTKV